MKFDRKETKKPVASHTGANVGDKVIFSPHHPKNASDEYIFKYCDVTPNKIYTINSISQNGNTCFQNDAAMGSLLGASESYRGAYDIVEKAPIVPAPKVFEPVTITLETQAELDLMTALLGSVNGDFAAVYGAKKIDYPIWHKYLHSNATPDYKVPQSASFY